MEVPRPHVISELTHTLEDEVLERQFWKTNFRTLSILLMTDSETVMVETIRYSNIGLTHCL